MPGSAGSADDRVEELVDSLQAFLVAGKGSTATAKKLVRTLFKKETLPARCYTLLGQGVEDQQLSPSLLPRTFSARDGNVALALYEKASDEGDGEGSFNAGFLRESCGDAEGAKQFYSAGARNGHPQVSAWSNKGLHVLGNTSLTPCADL